MRKESAREMKQKISQLVAEMEQIRIGFSKVEEVSDLRAQLRDLEEQAEKLMEACEAAARGEQ